jgi:uncharacterized protein YgfB (UPF0149 family)
MDRIAEIVEMALRSEAMTGWVDAFLLCLGLTVTVASAVPVLQALRQAKVKGQ